MNEELAIRFSRAFYGGGSDHDKAVAAFDMADRCEAFDQSQKAYLFEKIAEFYSKRSLENVANSERQGK